LLSPSNTSFWKQYEVELGYYHSFGLIQGYFLLITFWYLKPGKYFWWKMFLNIIGFLCELALFFVSRILAIVTCQPLGLLASWAKVKNWMIKTKNMKDNDFDHVKVLKQIVKKDGKLGLLAGKK